MRLATSDDDSTHISNDDSINDPRSDEDVCSGNSEDSSSSIGDSEDGMDTLSYHETVPVHLSELRRRSGVIQMSHQQLVQGLQPTFDSLPDLNDSATCDDSKALQKEMDVPSDHGTIPAPPSGLRRLSSITQMSHQELVRGIQASLDSLPDFDTAATGNDSMTSQDEDYLENVRLLKPDGFLKFLEAHNVPVTSYGRGRARCLQDLWAEIVVRECSLKRVPDPLASGKCFLQRSVRVLVLEVTATIEGTENVLLLKQEVNIQGHARADLDACTTTKIFDDEDIPSAIHRCFRQNLGLECSAAEGVFAIESEEDVNEVRESTAYPGLRTMYMMHMVHMRVCDIFLPKLAAIGLPSGSSFTTEMMVSALGVGKRLTWCWCAPDVMKAAKRAEQGRTSGLVMSN